MTSTYRGVNTSSMERRVLSLIPPEGRTLLDLRRRAQGQGNDCLGLILAGGVFRVSPAFGATVERLAFGGVIQIERDRRGKIRVLRGRNFWSVP